MKTWDELKGEGSNHYKTGGVEPVDLYKDKGVFRAFALCSIVKYATRNMDKELNPSDIRKIIHYSEFLLAEHKEYCDEHQVNITIGSNANGMRSQIKRYDKLS